MQLGADVVTAVNRVEFALGLRAEEDEEDVIPSEIDNNRALAEFQKMMP